ncbi:oxidoreductase [Actinorhabdospora filicis]|uniref:Oxidoreductase n=1 Tax=Actinorhabdospora filicis TaxID=1785913 RepID=A0A9W6W9Y0_9ACTN|nr:Gfo/Idh/MocA family oxidoreductase [Actinorhabdospora filicis]GLZ79099.1 oxidoreductase [Actinorhabdospora filicis]
MAAPRIALIGAGSMGSLHARVISQSERAELALVVDPVQQTGEAITGRFGGTWAPSLDDVSGIDAVVIAAPTSLHYKLAAPVLEAGLPLLVEKPVTSTYEESAELVDVAAKNRIPLMCGFVERFNPAIVTVAAMVEDPVHLAAVRHGPYAPRIRTGVAWDLLIHDVDACLRLVGGEAAGITGGTGRFHPSSLPDAEDVADAVVTFANGSVATCSASRLGHRKVRTLSITERQRVIEIDLLRRDVTIYRHVSNDLQMESGLGYRQQTIIEIPELVTNVEPLVAQLNRFLGLLDGTVDIDEERESILAPHKLVAQMLDGS